MLVSYYITEMDHTYAINQYEENNEISQYPWDHTYAINQDEENSEILCDHTYAKNLGQANNAIPGPGKSEEEGMSGERDEVEVKDPGKRVLDLFLDEKTFILMQKSEKATYKQIARKWTGAGNRLEESTRPEVGVSHLSHFSVLRFEICLFSEIQKSKSAGVQSSPRLISGGTSGRPKLFLVEDCSGEFGQIWSETVKTP